MPKKIKPAPRFFNFQKLMDIGMQVQARYMRGWHDTAYSEENRLKTEALTQILKMKVPRDPKLLVAFIKDVRTVAKLGLATVNLDFERKTA